MLDFNYNLKFSFNDKILISKCNFTHHSFIETDYHFSWEGIVGKSTLINN